MPSFDKRRAELKARFDQGQPNMLPEEIIRIASSLETYYTKREQLLKDLAALLADNGNEFKRKAYEDRLGGWKDVIQELNNLLRDVDEPSLAALALQATATNEEAIFWDGLSRLDPGDVRDRLMLLGWNLAEYTKALDTKWYTMNEADKAIDDAERAATDQINRYIREALEQGAPAWTQAGKMGSTLYDGLQGVKRDIVNYFKDKRKELEMPEMVDKVIAAGVDYAVKSLKDKAGPVGKEVISSLEKGMQTLQPYLNGWHAEKVYELRSRMANQNAVLVTFSTTRQEADLFLRENGVDIARRKYDDARSALQSWVNAQRSDALQKDAAEFLDEVSRGWLERLNTIHHLFSEFIEENQGRFVGDVKSAVKEALLEPEYWEDLEYKLVHSGLDQQLRYYRSGMQELDLSIENAFGALSFNTEDLPLNVQDAMRRGVEQVRAEFVREVKAQLERASRSIDAAEQHVASDKLQQALDRRPLEALVR